MSEPVEKGAEMRDWTCRKCGWTFGATSQPEKCVRCGSLMGSSGARSPESYEREIRSLSQALHDECANSLRLSQELVEARKTLDDLALREHQAAHPTPPSGAPVKVEQLEGLAPPKTTVFRKKDGTPLIKITLTHTFSKMTRVRRRRDV